MVASPADLHDPAARNAAYGKNIAQWLLDLHDSKSTFDFCGGMLFQLVLSDKLRSHLQASVASDSPPAVFDAKVDRMAKMPGYGKSAAADNVSVFYGREVRQVRHAAGGMGLCLQLVFAGGDDPEGWTKQEIQGYDGWGHDRGRVWRKGAMLESEGYTGFGATFGPDAFTLHHRFYFHKDKRDQIWLSAEDGCEGEPAMPL